MDWLNYHHLNYFYVTAKEGSVTAAARKLRLAQPTISAQIKQLEQQIGQPLFERVGRKLILTDTGVTVLRYAEEIFGLGQELSEALRGGPTGRALRLRVGAVDVLPKLVVYRLLAPALADGPRLVVLEEPLDRLVDDLVAHELDVVLADSPASTLHEARVANHLLAECGVGFFATASLAKKLRGPFPRCLDGAPFLLPAGAIWLRHALEEWFDRAGVRPDTVGEFEDHALVMAFGQAGVGVFVAPSAIGVEVTRQFGVVDLGVTEEIRQRFYAITAGKRSPHSSVQAMLSADVFKN